MGNEHYFCSMKSALTGLLLIFNFAALSQTCIIIYVSNKGIIAGADKKYHQTLTKTDPITGKQQKNLHVFYGKKIFTGKNGYWALSGADYYDTIHTICKEVCGVKGSLQKIVNRFQKRLQNKTVKKAIHELFLISNEEQKKRFKGNLTEAAFFKFDGKAYKSYRITISMPGIFKNDETLHFETDSIVATKKTFDIFVLGHYDAFNHYSAKEKWEHPAATIRKLIKQQSEYTPVDVSPGSDIIQITKTGFSWVPHH